MVRKSKRASLSPFCRPRSVVASTANWSWGKPKIKLNKDTARHRLLTDKQAFLDDPRLKPLIEENWRFIFQEPLLPERLPNGA